MVKNENFFIVFGWMINELHLKGSELCVYAIIYGFSQDGESWFEGARQYLADFSGISKTAVDGVLARLQEKGLIEKKEFFRNGVKFNNYKVTPLQVSCTSPSKFLVHPLQETCTHNIKIKYRDNIDSLPPYNTPHEPTEKSDGNTPLEHQRTKGEEVVEEVKHRINVLFNRRESTAWSDKETKQLKTVAKREGVLDELIEIETLYNSGYQYRRRDVITFLNNFDVELDRARNKALPTYMGRPRNVDLDKYDI